MWANCGGLEYLVDTQRLWHNGVRKILRGAHMSQKTPTQIRTARLWLESELEKLQASCKHKNLVDGWTAGTADCFDCGAEGFLTSRKPNKKRRVYVSEVPFKSL